jgi:DNA polymerase III delta prime subunit
MGSLVVLSMADHEGPSAPGAGQTVHPFFTAKRLAPSDVLKEAAGNDTAAESNDPNDAPRTIVDVAAATQSQDEAKPKKRRKLKNQVDADTGLPADSEKDKSRQRRRTKPPPAGNILKHFGIDGASNTAPDLDIKSTTKDIPGPLDHAPKEDIAALPKPLSHTAPSMLNTDNAAKPKKTMMFNPKTGTIGSPPKPKAPKPGPGTEASKQTVSIDGTISKSTSKLVRIQYGKDDASRKRIGEKVSSILKSPPKTKSPRTPRKKKAAQHADSSPRIKKSQAKSTHPLFAGKGKLGKQSNAAVEPTPVPTQPPRPKRNTIQSSTPCSPRKPRTAPSKDSSNTMPQFSAKSMGLKFPGSKPPAWPWKDMVHVRGGGAELPLGQQAPSHSIPLRKSKGRAVRISLHDSLVDTVTERLDVPAHAEAVRNANSDDFLPPPTELRLPIKHFESGSKLQLRILPQLKCSSRLATNTNSQGSKKRSVGNAMVADDRGVASHPRQLVRLFNQIRTNLSAFDRADCDNISWAQKYAPSCAAEILQSGQEAFILKDWLQALVVQSVDTGSGNGGDDKEAKANAAALPKKRGRKRKKLDNFIVSSDEEGSLLEEIWDNEHDWTPSGKYGIVKKTVIRSAGVKAKEQRKNWGRLTNAIVISGPHGCGKTAAVYAVAKELDFEVFEINSSSRRSGKDVDEKIGDMLNYHHVNHQNDSRDKPAAKEGDAEAKEAEAELAKEIALGKQKTMASFFTKKTVPIKKVVEEPPVVMKPATAALKEPKRDPPKSQKQSLILLDEVDILYDEDKQFWAKVIELIVKSKRPFIMTCNDETLLPLHNLNLHGIFRLSHPPTDLAVDRLLLIAANEGHALRREPVEALYVCRNHDLRAATAELNYWCQMGVGDRRGGFEWFYPRWPKGVDLDEDKQVVRVVSEDTYELGMGWLCRDMVMDQQTQVEEEILQQSWDLWDLDAASWQDSPSFTAWVDGVSRVATDRSDQVAALGLYDAFTDAMSAADICSWGSFARFNEVCSLERCKYYSPLLTMCLKELIDATTTDFCRRSADDHIVGLPMLDAPPAIHHDRMGVVLAITMKSMAKAALDSTTKTLLPRYPSHLPSLDESTANDLILHHSSMPPVDAPAVSRIDFSMAFDPIAASDKPGLTTASYLDPSVLDRNMEPITLDVAPYIRAIVAYDTNLQQQRLRLSNLISEGGRKGPKRMRTTRAAYSAMEGGSRKTTRPDRWFKAELNPHLVMKTGGSSWTDLVVDNGHTENGTATTSSPPSPTKPVSSPGSTTARESPSPVKTDAVRKGRGRPRKVVADESEDELA